MTMFVLFGVKAPDALSVDEASKLVQMLIGRAPTKRQGGETGDYCTFDSETGDEIKLVVGSYEDEDGPYAPEPEFPDWKYLLYLDNTNPDSLWLKALEQSPDRFKKLKTDVMGEWRWSAIRNGPRNGALFWRYGR